MMIRGRQFVPVIVHGGVHGLAVIGHHIGHLVMKRRFVACAGGVCLILGGTALIEYQPAFVARFVWEGFCYVIHGIGCIPLLKPLDHAVGNFVEGQQPVSEQLAEVAEAAAEELE